MRPVRVAEITKLIRRGKKSSDPFVKALAEAASEIGAMLLEERAESPTACGICVLGDGGVRGFKRDRHGSLRWAFFCRDCTAKAKRRGWDLKK